MNDFLLKYFNDFARTSELLRALAIFISKPVGYTFIILAGLLPMFLAAKNKVHAFIFFGITLGSTWIVAHTIKLIFKIARPGSVSGEVLMLVQEKGYSFPSEHASVFAALAVLGWFYDVRFGILLTGVALFVGVSRIIAGVHYPVDVFAGFCVGTLVGITICMIGKDYV